ncbi:MAG: O-antigen ligase family protein [Phycisphaeraceae bacterium]
MSRRERNRKAGQASPIQAAGGDAIHPNERSLFFKHALSFAVAVMLGLVFIRCVVPMSPNLYWDSDPRQAAAATLDLDGQELSPLAFGPAGAAWLEVLTILSAGIVLGLFAATGGRLRWWAFALALPAVIVAWVHIGGHIDNLFILGGWLSGISVALAAFHAAERLEVRKLCVAALLALALPLAVDAAQYVVMDHPESVEFFKETEKDWLAAKGWEKGSPEHEIYVRRLEQPEAFGSFTFSNVFGSVNAALALLALGASAAMLLRPQTRQGPIGLTIFITLMACVAVLCSHSRGAMLAMVLTGGLVAMRLLAAFRPRWQKWIAPLALMLIAFAFGAVIARGLAGPPKDATGERSLLFRWHYWQASARIATESSNNMILGIGPAPFQDAYARLKSPINPEEVRSAHNVFVDTIVNLGIAGWLLVALMILWLLKAARMRDEDAGEDESRDDPIPPDAARSDTPSANALQIETPDLAKLIALMTIVFGTELVVRWNVIQSGERFLLWSVGPIAFLFIAAVLLARTWIDARAMRFGLLAAATVLLVHNQIEMTFFQPNSAPLAWLIVALAAAGRKEDAAEAVKARESAVRLLPAIAFVLLALMLAVMHAAPLAKEQLLLAEAQRVLRRDPNAKPAFDRTLDLLHEASTAYSTDPRPYEWESRLAAQAANMIRGMLNTEPSLMVRKRDEPMIRQYLDRAYAALDGARAAGIESVSLKRQRAQLVAAAGRLTGKVENSTGAIELHEELILLSPYTPLDRIELGELYRKAGRREEAAAQYRHALQLSVQAYLDPLRQMTKTDRERIEAMLKAVTE